jgi:hypothetical protein
MSTIEFYLAQGNIESLLDPGFAGLEQTGVV